MENTETKPKKKINLSFKNVFVFPISPVRQFRRLVIASFILLLVTVGFHLYIFYGVESRSLFGEGQSLLPRAPEVNDKKLTEVLSRYDAKEAVRAKASTMVPVVVEPGR